MAQPPKHVASRAVATTLRSLGKGVYHSAAFRLGAGRAAAVMHRALARRAQDITEDSVARRCLVIAPHPDDETLGCGSTIARKRAADTDVYVVIVSDGRHANPSSVIAPAALARLRRDEGVDACAVLGVSADRVTFLGIEDGTVRDHQRTVTDAVLSLLERTQPEEVLVVSGLDHHPDHVATNRATRQALQEHRASGAAPVVLEFPVWFWDAKSWVDRGRGALRQALQLWWRPLRWSMRLSVRAVHGDPRSLDAKRAALATHRTQMTNYTGEAGWPTMDPAFLDHFLTEDELFFA